MFEMLGTNGSHIAITSSNLTGRSIKTFCVKNDFQNFSGVACHQNNRFGQSDSSSVTHAQKTKNFVPNLLIGDY